MSTNRIVQVLGFLGALAFTLRGQILLDRIMKEVNLKAAPNERIPAFSWTSPAEITKRHEQLYPESDLRRKLRLSGFGVAAFVLIVVWFI